ncbi:MAG: hypothetical protein JWM93_2509 [Frankiales bacterium]|nr:hypothetical protein [Frankiales bacterium]
MRWFPWLRPLFAWLVRFRWPALAVLAVLCAIVPQADPAPTDIDVFFLKPALRLVQHGDLSVFTPEIQIGPVCLALLGIGAAAAQALGFSGTLGASVVLALCALGVVAAAVKAVLPREAPRPLVASYQLCLGVILLWGCTPLATSYGHIEEMFLGLMLVGAGAEARRGHGGRAGIWLALAVGFKLWAAIGIVVLVLSRRRRDAAIAAVIGVVGGVAVYAPFVLAGSFRTFDFHWTVQKAVPVSLLLGADAPFGFGARLLQVALACTVAAVIALRLRHDDRALWLVPATLIAARLLPDPMLLPYYWTGLVACFIVGVALTGWPPVLRALACIALPAVVLTGVIVLRDHPSRPVLTVLSVVAVAVCVWCARGPRKDKAVNEAQVLAPEDATILV